MSANSPGYGSCWVFLETVRLTKPSFTPPNQHSSLMETLNSLGHGLATDVGRPNQTRVNKHSNPPETITLPIQKTSEYHQVWKGRVDHEVGMLRSILRSSLQRLICKVDDHD